MFAGRTTSMVALFFTAWMLVSDVGAAEKKRGAYRGAMATQYPSWFKDTFIICARILVRPRCSITRLLRRQNVSRSQLIIDLLLKHPLPQTDYCAALLQKSTWDHAPVQSGRRHPTARVFRE